MNNAFSNKSHPTEAPVIPVGIVGARGYSGAELARLLLLHPSAQLMGCFSGHAGDFRLSDYLPEEKAKSVPSLPMENLHETAAKVVFLATPAEVSAQWAPVLLARGIHVIDLSGAHRLKAPGAAEKWYGKHGPYTEYLDPKCLQRSIYGLCPWESTALPHAGPVLVANPGCYATSVLIALLPLLKSGVIDPASIVIDAKSGTTGAGRSASEALLFSEVDGECLPYKVGGHQHFPEIQEALAKWTGLELDPFFTTSLLPARRGIISGIYARLSAGADSCTVDSAFKEAYQGYPLVRWGKIEIPKGSLAPLHLKLRSVVGSPRVHIAYQVESDRAGKSSKLYLFSLIDNLLKGAASQAVENFNRLYSLPLNTGLEVQEGSL